MEKVTGIRLPKELNDFLVKESKKIFVNKSVYIRELIRLKMESLKGISNEK